MIDRKTLWICGLVFLAMMLATVWRSSLLPDWLHFAPDGPGHRRHISSLWLFMGPFGLLFTIAVMYARKWFASGPEENVQPWRRWTAMMLIPYAAVLGLTQAFAISRSLGFAMSVDRIAVAHTVFVVMGIMMMVLGNMMPKMPWLSARFRPFQLDPWQWNRQLRFMGKVMVGFGLFMAIGAPLLPPPWFMRIFWPLWLAFMAAGILYRIKLRREPSPHP